MQLRAASLLTVPITNVSITQVRRRYSIKVAIDDSAVVSGFGLSGQLVEVLPLTGAHGSPAGQIQIHLGDVGVSPIVPGWPVLTVKP